EAYLKIHRKQTNQTELQFFDADLVATRQHLYFAILNALQAFRSKTNISKSIAMEMMLFASAQRQIQKAIEHIGIKPASSNLAVVIVGCDFQHITTQLVALSELFSSSSDESVLEITPAKQQKIRSTFQIGDEEIILLKEPPQQSIVALVIERMALLSTQV
ncbi:MAG: KEOPS complex subunit Cgi121, partial [Candidatus Bathyarchaeia archaeon]